MLPPRDVKLHTLTVEVTPADAEIRVNGGKWVKAPLDLSDVTEGSEYTIEIQKPGYEVWNKNVTITSSAPIQVQLEPLLAQVSVQSFPEGANVFFNGTLIGVTPWSGQHPHGEYTLRVEKNGRRIDQFITLKPGQTHPFEIKLPEPEQKEVIKAKEPAKAQPATSSTPITSSDKTSETSLFQGTGILRVDSTPRGASVLVNGQKAGITPVVVPDLLAGQDYQIVLEYPGYPSYRRSVRITKPKTEISIPLKKE
jgi:hypothetical protein